jgi:hypothetical protein
MPRKLKDDNTPRKIEKSLSDRLYWQPGDKHPLDVLFGELDQLRQHIPEELAALLTSAQTAEQHLSAIMEATQDTTDATGLFTTADHESRRTVIDRFHNRKHSDHLLTILTIQRYKRLIGRMNAIKEALDLVNGLLEEEEAFSPQSEASPLRPPQQAIDRPSEVQEKPQTSEEPVDQQDPPTKAELRLQGIDEPLTPIVGEVTQSRQLLQAFEGRIPDLRRGLTLGQGWFEVFYISKYHFKTEVVLYMKALLAWQEHHTPIPTEIEQAIHPEVARLLQIGADIPKELRDEAYDCTKVGPYVKYRWHDSGRTYTVSLGLLDDYPPLPFMPSG